MEAKQGEETSISFCFEAKLKIEVKRSEMKNYLKRCKVKKSCFLSLWLEAQNLKQKDGGKIRESVRNGSGFASFRFKATFFCETGAPYSTQRAQIFPRDPSL